MQTQQTSMHFFKLIKKWDWKFRMQEVRAISSNNLSYENSVDHL